MPDQTAEAGDDSTPRVPEPDAPELPTILYDTRNVVAGAALEDGSGAVWKLDVSKRHLDANVINLPPAAEIRSHLGPDLDVLLHVVDGDGALTTASGRLTLSAGVLVWLPRGSRRAITAGQAGLRYLSVHPRRPALSIEAAPSDAEPASEHPIEILQRWESFGGTWQVVSQTPDSVTISLCRCDGGEEAHRLTSADPALFKWLAGRDT
jgi:hypothetical protein